MHRDQTRSARPTTSRDLTLDLSARSGTMRPAMRKLLLIDLFSGGGGSSCGFSQCNLVTYEPALAIDQDRWAIASFKSNFPTTAALRLRIDPVVDTVTDAYRLYRRYVREQRQGHDGVVVLASPPCEPFSEAANTLRSVNDPRNDLVRSVVTWAAAVHPLALVVENVRQMKLLHEGRVHRALVEGLAELNYRVAAFDVNAIDYGVPQIRRRLLYLAYRGDLSIDPALPSPTHAEPVAGLGRIPYVTVRAAIGDLPVRSRGAGARPFVSKIDPDREWRRLGYYAAALRSPAGELVSHHQARPLTGDNLRRVKALAPGEAMEDLPPRLRPAQGFPGSYGKLDPDRPAATITAHFSNPGSGRYFHYSQMRVITPREGARLQGFPDRYVWSGYQQHVIEQIGDAVPPPLAHAFGHEIALQLAKAGAIELPDATGNRHCVFRHLEVPHAQNAPAQATESVVRATVA